MKFEWAIGICTAPRAASSLELTLQCIKKAGWDRYYINNDLKGIGPLYNWLETLKHLCDLNPYADAYLIFEDDILVARRLRNYLEKHLWPERREKIALCSIFTPADYYNASAGWHEQNHGRDLTSSQAWIIPPESAKKVIRDLADIDEVPLTDSVIGRWSKENKRSVWYHSPSLIQHIGICSSSFTNNYLAKTRYALDFIGTTMDVEDFMARPEEG